MVVTVDQVRAEVNTGVADSSLLDRCLSLALQLVQTYLEDNLDEADVTALPEVVRDQATLMAAVDLFNQAKAPNGVVTQEFDIGNGEVASTPIRISRDPLRGARAVLELYVGPAIG